MTDNKANFLFLLQTLLLGQIITHKMSTDLAEIITDEALEINAACIPVPDANTSMRSLVWKFVSYKLGNIPKPVWLIEES